MLDTQQSDFMAAVAGDTTGLHDIADELDVQKPGMTGEQVADKEEMSLEDYEAYRKVVLPAISGDGYKLVVPSYVEQSIATGLKKNEENEYTGYTGPRSQMFDHLLE